MRRKVLFPLFVVSAAVWAVTAAWSQPPEGDERPPCDEKSGVGAGPGGPGAAMTRPLFQALDADQDGALTPEEFRLAPEMLRRMDASRAARGERPPGPNGPGPRGFAPRGPGRPEGLARGDDPRPPRGGPRPDGAPGPRRPPTLGDVLPPHVREELDLTEEQDRALANLESETKSKLREILTETQVEQFGAIIRRGPPGPPPGAPPGPPRGRGRPPRPPGDDSGDRRPEPYDRADQSRPPRPPRIAPPEPPTTD